MTYRSIFRSDLLSGESHIVTGAGSGIGRAITHEIASLGGRVAMVGRKIEKLEAVAAELREAGYLAPTLHAFDIRDEDAVREGITEIVSDHGRIHGLVNNAGGQFPAPLASINKKGWDAVIATNLTGGFLVARETLMQTMGRHGGGSIVNIIADMWTSMPGMGHSGAARAGMLNFTMTAAVEWAAAGVRVNAVAPGWIESSGLDTYPESVRPMIEALPTQLPAQRLGTVSEVSAAVTYLLSEAAAFVSGSCIRVDGAAPNARLNWPMDRHDAIPPYDGFSTL